MTKSKNLFKIQDILEVEHEKSFILTCTCIKVFFTIFVESLI